jgi:hypothetical protein
VAAAGIESAGNIRPEHLLMRSDSLQVHTGAALTADSALRPGQLLSRKMPELWALYWEAAVL